MNFVFHVIFTCHRMLFCFVLFCFVLNNALKMSEPPFALRLQKNRHRLDVTFDFLSNKNI